MAAAGARAVDRAVSNGVSGGGNDRVAGPWPCAPRNRGEAARILRRGAPRVHWLSRGSGAAPTRSTDERSGRAAAIFSHADRSPRRRMNYARWIAHFETNRLARPEPGRVAQLRGWFLRGEL